MHFHLAGINNQNFLMRDEETGSFWQQITGAAITGPLKGARLSLIAQDELSFALWKEEQPQGTVLAPVARDEAHYEKADWETSMQKTPTVIHGTKGTLPDRETIFGIERDGVARAFPVSKLTAGSPVLEDEVGDEPIMLLLGPDQKSIRAFSRKSGADTLEFYRGAGEGWSLMDSNTLSAWNFEGCATAGDMKGRCLAHIDTYKDFWFDWQHYHPASSIYRR